MTAVACEPSVPAMNQMWSDTAHVAAPPNAVLSRFIDLDRLPEWRRRGLAREMRAPLVAPSGVVEELAR